MCFSYIGYGLKIKSDLEIKEFIKFEGSESYDLEIFMRNIPLEHRTDILPEKKVRFTKKRFCFYIKDIAMYFIKDPQTIIIEPSLEANMEQVKTYLLGVCMGLLLYMRKTLAIHGAAMSIYNQGVIFVGSSGAGKSTLTSALMKRGHEFLSDDISALTTNSSIKVHPGYGGQRFCKDVVERLGYEEQDYEIISRHGKEKYIVPFKKEFSAEPKELKYIFFLKVTDEAECKIREIKGIEKFDILINKIYGLKYMKRKGIHIEIIEQAIMVANKVPIYELARPRELNKIEERMDFIENLVLKQSIDEDKVI